MVIASSTKQEMISAGWMSILYSFDVVYFVEINNSAGLIWLMFCREMDGDNQPHFIGIRLPETF